MGEFGIDFDVEIENLHQLYQKLCALNFGFGDRRQEQGSRSPFNPVFFSNLHRRTDRQNVIRLLPPISHLNKIVRDRNLSF